MTQDRKFHGVTFECARLLHEDLPGIFHSTFDIRGFYFCSRLDQFTVCDGDGRALLVDTGHPLLTDTSHLDASHEQLRVPWGNMQVHITHLHDDHIGNAFYLMEQGARLSIGEHRPYDPADTERLLVATGLAEKGDFALADQASYLMGDAPQFVPILENASLLPEGSAFELGRYRFEVLNTPGHTSSHTCLVDRSAGILFAGDHVIDSAPGLMQCYPDEHLLSRYLGQIDSLRRMGLEHVLMSHAESIHGTAEINRFLTALMGKYDRPLRRIMGLANGSEAFTTYELAELYYSRLPGGLAGQPDILRGRRIVFTLGFLEFLCDIGMLGKENGSDGVRRYWATGHATLPSVHELYSLR